MRNWKIGFFQNLTAKIALLPMIATALVVFVGGTIWTITYSFTGSKLIPRANWVGLDQYQRLWDTSRWVESYGNVVFFSILNVTLTLVIGFTLATLLDRKIRFENTFRTIILYPFAMSFIVSGLVWQWILNPEFGIQKIIRDVGWTDFVFNPVYDENWVIYGLLIAGIWQGSGLIMVLMLASIRRIDNEIWNATRIDGIPAWKVYLVVVIPMIRAPIVTAVVIVGSGSIKLFDLVVAMTSGGPGISSEVPAKYVYDMMFAAQNLGQGFAASTMMFITVVIILVPLVYLGFGRKAHI